MHSSESIAYRGALCHCRSAESPLSALFISGRVCYDRCRKETAPAAQGHGGRHAVKDLSGDHQHLQPKLCVLSRHKTRAARAYTGRICISGREAPPAHGLSLSARHGRAAGAPAASGAAGDRGRTRLPRYPDDERDSACLTAAGAAGRAAPAQGAHQPALVRGK